MKFYTHINFGLFLGLVLLFFFDFTPSYLFLIFILFGALIPDIDATKSFLGKRLYPLSLFLKIIFSHRGFFHSFTFVILLVLVSFLVLPEPILFGLFIGIQSHIILDSFTPKGIPPFWPFQMRINGNIKTGSIKEFLLLTILIPTNFTLIYIHFF
jgi:inner membrane protein